MLLAEKFEREESTGSDKISVAPDLEEESEDSSTSSESESDSVSVKKSLPPGPFARKAHFKKTATALRRTLESMLVRLK